MQYTFRVGSLLDKLCWIFDLDGTLTQQLYDFPAIKRQLGIPPDQGILETMRHMEPEKAARVGAELDAIEDGIARRSIASPGAEALLQSLHARGCRLGILTRNTKARAHLTLDILGFDHFFNDEDILGREEAPHKPDPAGINHLLANWSAGPDDALFIGDNIYDVQTGRSAGVTTVHFDPEGDRPHADLADLTISSLNELIQAN
ncbi:MAG: HAD family hydrolase [Acidobacteriota bacterium]|nr:HAD family hydrolase [Acidobacteriota bacterium]